MNNLVISNPAAISPPPDQVISDSELARKATSLLRWKIRYNAIRVEAEKGHVILSGKVDWPSDITAAEQTVLKLSGVLKVTNRIVAQLPIGPGPETGNRFSLTSFAKCIASLQDHSGVNID